MKNRKTKVEKLASGLQERGEKSEIGSFIELKAIRD